MFPGIASTNRMPRTAQFRRQAPKQSHEPGHLPRQYPGRDHDVPGESGSLWQFSTPGVPGFCEYWASCVHRIHVLQTVDDKLAVEYNPKTPKFIKSNLDKHKKPAHRPYRSNPNPKNGKDSRKDSESIQKKEGDDGDRGHDPARRRQPVSDRGR